MVLPERYTRPAIILHWLIAALMIVNFALGQFSEAFGEDYIRFMINAHKSTGITVLGLVLLRILWRLTHQPPALPANFKPWEKRASHAAHMLLYFLMFALPLSGWMHDSAWKAAPEIKMYWFGLFEWPRISWIMELEPVLKEQWHSVLGEVHEIMGKVLLALFVLHVGGALKHQFIDKHPELQRMWR
jgi:cytochrome b561